MEISQLEPLWDLLNSAVTAVGWVVAFLTLLTLLAGIWAWFTGILTPLYRLGLGLKRKKIVVVSSSEEASNLVNLVADSAIFNHKRIITVTSRECTEDIQKGDVVLFKYSGSPFSLKEVLQKKQQKAAVVIYAKPNEIPRDSEDWALMDQYRNISVCNLKGRLLNDLLTLMMTTKL